MLDKPGLYVHLPWCVRKCPYCDFNSHPLQDETSRTAYTGALLKEWAYRAADFSEQPRFSSVFFGGGTPSLFEPESFAALLEVLPLQAGAEVTLEANPGTTEHADFAGYLHAGINRLSIGAQSFSDTSLHHLGRIHTAEEIRDTYHAAVAAGFKNINVDLMWGLPNQTLDAALYDLENTISLCPAHISWYQLTIEPRTEFARRPPVLPLEDVLTDIEASGLAHLETSGYQRYEVSAFSRSKPCAHNLNYWRFGDYVGIGAGAHGKLRFNSETHRTENPRQPRLYLNDPCNQLVTTVAEADLKLEFMLNVLRLKEGVEFETFQSTTGLSWDRVAGVWHSLVEAGFVRADRCATTEFGYRYLDSVVAEFMPR